MRIVVTGLIGQYALSGVTWDYVQYLLGFRALGHEVWYLEDSGAWPYDPVAQTVSADATWNLAYLDRALNAFGFGERWIYRHGATGEFFGAGEWRARDLLRTADLLVNVSSAGWLRDYDLRVGHQMLIDGDPLFSQIDLLSEKSADYRARVLAHDSHFSFGLNLGAPDCGVPEVGVRWRPTVQPIALDYWSPQPEESSGCWTTVMNWASYAPREWEGVRYGQKDREFTRFLDLPGRTTLNFKIAMSRGFGGTRPTETLRQQGWDLLEAEAALPDPTAYHEFLSSSRAEWSVAKHGYVCSRTGWFSGRTACYLALGRPALVQETGWSKYLPSGAGLLAFSNLEEVVEGLSKIEDAYRLHQVSARSLAEEYFDAKKVCANLLAHAS